MHTVDITESNIERIGRLFPDCLTERIGEDGKEERAIDFDLLRQELSKEIVEGPQERYQFTWPDKKKAIRLANSPSNMTLRPCREESVDFDNTKNLYIEGDNLEVLKLLREDYLGKVKMIYIDPPYNTGNDFVYEDDFSQAVSEYVSSSGQIDAAGNRLVQNTESNGRFHTDWLNMMYPRLKLGRDFMSEDGVIFISIDENEVENLKKIASEIFGEDNFAGEIIWKNSSKNDEAYVSIQHEYILCYVKNKSVNQGDWVEYKEGLDEIFKAFEGFRKKYGSDWKSIHKAAQQWYKQFPESNPIYNSKHYSWMDERGVYFPDNISGPNFGQYRYDVIHPITGKVVKQPASGWRYPEDTMKKRIQDNLVHFGDDETTVPNNKTYLADTITQSLTSIKFKDGRAASKYLASLMGAAVFNNPKDTSILELLMKAIGIQEGDIVLDFFSGSGSTGQAVMELAAHTKVKANFILVQIQENLDTALTKATGSTKTILKNAIELCDSLHVPHVLPELAKERLKRARISIDAALKSSMSDGANLFGQEEVEPHLDMGFRVLKLDSSNMNDVYYRPEEFSEQLIKEENVKEGRTPEDLLFQVMLECNLPLSAKIQTERIAGKEVFSVNNGYLVACFDDNVNEEVIKAVAKRKPYYFIMRDSSLCSDNVADNFEQIFKAYSKETIRRIL